VAALQRPRSASEVASALRLDARAVGVVARALEGYGYLAEDADGRLALTERGHRLLSSGEDEGDPAADVALSTRAIRAHLHLADVLRTGKKVDEVPAGDRLTRERFMRSMRHVASVRAPHTVAALGTPPRGARLLDVGGGPGTYARHFARAGWQVTVMDLPESLEIAAEELARDGIATLAGDATDGLPPGSWDCVYLGNFVHLFDRNTAASLVGRAGAAIAPGGLLALQEVVLESPQGPRFGVLMLLATDGGGSYPEADYLAWMAAAGCPHEKTVPLDEGWHHLLIGRKPA
jgi:SAM-dependent methyltransferase